MLELAVVFFALAALTSSIIVVLRGTVRRALIIFNVSVVGVYWPQRRKPGCKRGRPYTGQRAQPLFEQIVDGDVGFGDRRGSALDPVPQLGAEQRERQRAGFPHRIGQQRA